MDSKVVVSEISQVVDAGLLVLRVVRIKESLDEFLLGEVDVVRQCLHVPAIDDGSSRVSFGRFENMPKLRLAPMKVGHKDDFHSNSQSHTIRESPWPSCA